MEAHDREEILSALRKLMGARVTTQERLDKLTQAFTSQLYAALERALDDIRQSGIPGLGKYRRLAHPDGGREIFQMFVEDWSILFVPLSGFARPNPLDEARIANAQFKEASGRIVAFLGDDPQARAFYDFLIFKDGSWFAWGYGWPRQQDDIDHTDFDALALDLVYGFAKDIFITWQIRTDTTLASAMDKKKRPLTFGLPGEERQV